MTMAPTRSTWSARVERAPHGGVYLFVASPRGQSQVWFSSEAAAIDSAQGRQFRWRWSGAIGSTVTHRGELIDWGND
jgi:hypothetical protein